MATSPDIAHCRPRPTAAQLAATADLLGTSWWHRDFSRYRHLLQAEILHEQLAVEHEQRLTSRRPARIVSPAD